MNNAEILQKILSGHKKLVAYYPYPARGFDGEIAATDNHNGNQYDELLKNFINLCIQLGAALADRKIDNKTAVKMEVEGLDFPVYLRKTNGYYGILKEALPGDKIEIPISWNIGH